MPQPKKATVDYFPHYTSNGKTIYILESKFKNDGYAFWFKILEVLGRTEHHFINCNEKSTWQYLIAISNLNEDTINEILDLLSELGAIDQELWKLKIIRSENFIRNLSAIYQRRQIDVITKDEIITNMSTFIPLNGECVNIYPQSKVKESKVKESKVNATPDEPAKCDLIKKNAEEFFDYYVSLSNTANHEKGTKVYEEAIKQITGKGKYSLVGYLKNDEGMGELKKIAYRWNEYHRIVEQRGLRNGMDSQFFFENSFKKFLEKFTDFEDVSTANQKMSYAKNYKSQHAQQNHLTIGATVLDDKQYSEEDYEKERFEKLNNPDGWFMFAHEKVDKSKDYYGLDKPTYDKYLPMLREWEELKKKFGEKK